MFIIRNIFLDELLEKYNLKNVRELLARSDDEVKRFAIEAEVLPVYSVQRLGDAGTGKNHAGLVDRDVIRNEFNKRDTVERITRDNTVKVYMPSDFWEERHHEKARDFGAYDSLNKTQTGDEVYEIIKDLGACIILAPSEEAEVDFTQAFVEEVLIKMPVARKLYIKDVNGKEYDWIVPEGLDSNKTKYKFAGRIPSKPGKKKDHKEVVGLGKVEKIDYKTLIQMAKERGIDTKNKTKEQIEKDLATGA